MKRSANLWFLALVMLFVLYPDPSLSAQSQKIYFEEVRTPEGNPLGKVVAITQDALGFMWFADESNRMLVRYDGSHMEYYRHDPDNPNSPGGFKPHDLYTSPSGDIWIGYLEDGGLDRFDPYTKTFTHYRHDPDDPESLANNNVPSVFVDKDGMVWLATVAGLDRLDPTTGKFTHFSHDPNNTTSISSDVVWRTYEDLSGTLWMGTGLPFPGEPNIGGLNRFDREAVTFTRYLANPEDPSSLNGYKITAMLEDSKGNFWVGTEGDGLHTLDRGTGRFTRHAFDPDHPEKLSRPALASMDYAFISFLLEDSAGQIWIGTVDNGINRYDPDSDKVTHFGKSYGFREDVVANDHWKSFQESNSAWCAYAGQDGLIWISTETDPKLYKIDLFRNTIKKVNEPGINVFFEESSKVIWKGTSNGLIKEDLKAGTEILYQHRPEDPGSLSTNLISAITQDQQGKLWVGTFNGLNVLDPEVGTFKRYMHDPDDSTSLSHPWVHDIKMDSRGDIWVSTDNGLNRLNPNSEEFEVFLASPKDSPLNHFGDIVEDPQGALWFGGNEVRRFDPQTETFRNYPISASGILIDSKANLWAWNNTGLFKFDPERDQFMDSGITSNNNRVISDSQNNLWIHNTNGILQYDTETGKITLFGGKYGVIGSNTSISFPPYGKEDGTLLFSMGNDFYQFNPEDFWQSKDTSHLYANLLEISGSDDESGSSISLLGYNKKEEALTLAANQNAFSIWFSAIDFRGSGNTPIQYMLEGYDNEWVQGSAEFPAHYAQVSPGDYTFRLRTVNSSSGIPSENSVQLKILPPWWATWWAYALYALILVFGIWLVHRYQRKRVLRSAREKAQRRELAHAREIEKAYTDLKQTQTQLVHAEKMASLGELTAGIAHEIKNPLNFVNNFSEVSRELLEELMEELQKGDTAEVNAIAGDVIQNLEKISHHGQRADSIVKGMLQHSRSSDGKKAPTDLNALADEYLRLAYHGLRAKDKSFSAVMETDFDPDLPEVKVVPQDIGRVLLNLLTNAFYAVNDQNQKEQEGYEPTVWVKTRKTKAGVEISVRDNGGGIPEPIRNKIFQPFFTTKPTGQGTGLGLSMSFDIVKAPRGELGVKSREGEGTTFTIALPA